MRSPPVPWQNYVFFVVSVPSYILYLSILGIIITRRIQCGKYSTTFYSLLISLGVADIFATSTACFSNIIRTSNIWTAFYWENRVWVAPMSYNAANFAIMIRLFGAMLIALQRYVMVCYGHYLWTKKISRMTFLLVIFIHWFPAIIFSFPITLNFEKSLMGPSDMRLSIKADQQQLGALTQNIFVLVTFLISTFAYIQIFRLIIQTQQVFDTGQTRELRLSIVALGQGAAFLVTFVYFLTQYILAEIKSPLVDDMRPYMTLLTALMSYWNPYVYFFMNGDIRAEILKLFGCLNMKNGGSAILTSHSRNANSPRSPGKR